MKRYEVLLNGKIIADYARHNLATRRCNNMMHSGKYNSNDDELALLDAETGDIVRFI